MELNDKDYNVYVIEGVRPIKAGELKEKVSDYCKNNPDANCAGKIEDYCNNNPEDNRCQALFRAYCLNGNMEDTRCRQAFINWCKENPENKHCVPFALKWAKNYCEEHSDSNLCQKIATNVADFCKNNPENEGCITVKQIVAERPALLSKIQAIRGKIAALKINATLNTTPVVSSDVEGGE